MTPEAEALARHRLKRARETFAEGDVLLDHHGLPGALNRYYYAALYGARALLATRGLDSSKHAGVVSLFQQHFVRERLVDEETGKALPRALQRRLTSDYADSATVVADEVRATRGSVAAFLKECERALAGMSSTLPPPSDA